MMVSELVELRVRLERVEEVAARAWGMGPNQPTLTVRAVLTAYCNDDGRTVRPRSKMTNDFEGIFKYGCLAKSCQHLI